MTYEQIHNLFKQRYNQNNWKQFLGEAFANARLLTTPEILTGIDSNVASQVQKLGYITLNENGIERQIAVYEVTLAQGIILERNRVGLRNLLRKYWKDIDAAFIAYHRPDDSTGSSAKWRFTYVSELTGYDADGEFVKIKTEPKRYTYVLGEGESTRTAAERFTAIANKGSKATLDDVKDAFSVEKLSKAFFDEYKKHYDIFCDFMVSQPNIRQTIFNGDEKGIRDFNKKLLGRIVFLYFIQKKGWLGVPAKSDWGKGDFNFLTQQFENFRNKDLFYQEFLSPLFFETLNQKRDNDIFNYDNSQFVIHNSELIKIPYLNGGLFEEDDKKHRNLIFPANLFKNLFDFFNQYNFTIYEDDPNDHTVAVDPEMLGHIFENLLEDNKDKGAYYTPKEIVHYMCQESLIEYLTTHCLNPDLHDLGINMMDEELKETIGLFIKKKAFDLEALKKSSKSNESYKSWFRQLNDALDNVKICDPAIGSGAFPMGLLHEIFTAKQTLHTFEHGNTKTFDASGVKLNIIQNSIYGVDIEKGAVDIARLRFWLSLIVDEEKPKALPNLDYKIVVGNSLVSKLGDDIIDIDWTLNETSHGLFGADLAKQKGDLLKKISKEQKDFFNPDSDKKKLAADIRNLKIDLLITQLELMVKTTNQETEPKAINFKDKKKFVQATELYHKTIGWKNSIKDLQNLKNKPELPLHFFDWKLDFPEVLNSTITDKFGFDIVIGNPPYVSIRTKSFDKSFKEFFKSKYSLAVGQYDLYVLFIEKTYYLLNDKGILSYIIPKRMLSNESFEEARKFVLNNIPIFKYIDAEMPFENANVEANIMFGRKSVKAAIIESIYFDNIERIFKHRTNVDSKSIAKMPFNIFPFIFDENVLNVLFKIQAQKNSPLSEYIGITRGFECGYSDEAIDNKKSRYKLLKADAIKSFVIDDSNFIYCSPDFTNSSKYKTKELFEKVPKLLTKFVASKIEFALDEIGYYNTNSVYNGQLKSTSKASYYYLLSILNSKIITFWFNTAFLNTDTLFPHIQKNQLDAIPIVHFKAVEKKLSKIVERIIKLKSEGKDTISLEQEIDNLVYKIYELTYEEVKVIDPAFSLSQKEYEAIKLE